MRRILGIGMLTWVVSAFAAMAPADEPAGPFQGEWRTTIGVVKLVQKGEAVTGTYGLNGQFPLKGTAKSNVLTFEYESSGPSTPAQPKTLSTKRASDFSKANRTRDTPSIERSPNRTLPHLFIAP